MKSSSKTRIQNLIFEKADNGELTSMQPCAQLRKVVTTAEAARLLNRLPQTLRKWACYENGPIRPIRINRRLAWFVDEIAALLAR